MRFPVLGRWEDAETGEVLLERLFVAGNFWQRFRGLQLASPLEPQCGLMLHNCRSVHTMWMRFSIDLIFLSQDFQILETRLGVKPWRVVTPKAQGVRHVIEVVAGQHKNWPEGRRTRIEKDPGSPLSASGTTPQIHTGSPLPASGRGAGGEGLP
jgi:uncharacterized membrane protein (UPF0127 family)